MSNTKFDVDCCGDRYECNTSYKCNCGCKLFYCTSCYKSHMVAIAKILMKQFSKKKLKTILAKEIKKERREYDNI